MFQASQVFGCLQEAYAAAEAKLAEERATLTRFDDELKELDRVIKEKKEAVSNEERLLGTLESDIKQLNREKATNANFLTNLEKQYEWIKHDKQYVYLSRRSKYRADFSSVNSEKRDHSMISPKWTSDR